LDLSLLGELARHIFLRVPETVIPTTTGGLLFWAVMLLVWTQYRRLATMERRIHGFVRNDPWVSTGTALVFGVVAGIIGSFLMIMLGITLSQDDIIYLWPVALALLLLNPRLLCFSYAGGIVSIVHLLTGWPPGVNPTAIMGLVAVLHLMEGILVAVSGHRVVSPVYLKNDRSAVVGGYLVQRFWPIPIMIVFLLQLPPEATLGGFSMPDWWPLIDSGAGLGEHWAYVMTPVVAALGYSDIALTEMPVKRARRTAWHLVLFSVALLGFSLWAAESPAVIFVPVLFGPLGHELMIRLSSGREFRGKPKFVSGGDGVMIMDARPNRPGQALGLHPGDTVVAVNGQPIASRSELNDATIFGGWYIELTVVDPDGHVRTLESNRYPPGQDLGVITAPESHDRPHVNLGGEGVLLRLLKRLRRRWRWRA